VTASDFEVAARDFEAAARHAARLAVKLHSAADHLPGPGLELFRHELRGAANAAARLGVALDAPAALGAEYVSDLLGPDAVDTHPTGRTA
jgi:hypothetical protein